MKYLGKTPDCDGNGCPAAWDDGDCYMLQGQLVTDAATLAVIGKVPEGETVIRIPKRMMALFPEVKNEPA